MKADNNRKKEKKKSNTKPKLVNLLYKIGGAIPKDECKAPEPKKFSKNQPD